jgi:hypothetical protein
MYCVFLFPVQILSETFLILGRNERDRSNMCIDLHVRYRLVLPFSQQGVEKYSSTKFHENPSSWRHDIP